MQLFRSVIGIHIHYSTEAVRQHDSTSGSLSSFTHHPIIPSRPSGHQVIATRYSYVHVKASSGEPGHRHQTRSSGCDPWETMTRAREAAAPCSSSSRPLAPSAGIAANSLIPSRRPLPLQVCLDDLSPSDFPPSCYPKTPDPVRDAGSSPLIWRLTVGASPQEKPPSSRPPRFLRRGQGAAEFWVERLKSLQLPACFFIQRRQHETRHKGREI